LGWGVGLTEAYPRALQSPETAVIHADRTHFDLPHAPEDYVHRIGRTARAGASGRASTFVTERDEESVRAIERIIRMSLPRAEVPREDAVFIEEPR
jgi:superfamily II DNA/RNA helicase